MDIDSFAALEGANQGDQIAGVGTKTGTSEAGWLPRLLQQDVRAPGKPNVQRRPQLTQIGSEGRGSGPPRPFGS